MTGISLIAGASNCMTQNSIPRQSEVKSHLGIELAKIVFDQSHNEIKKKLGLLPPLDGPEKQLWISPSDQLIQKNNLKPPIHSNSIKACTHDGILLIGEQALEKFRQDTEERIRSKLYEDLIEEKNMGKAEKRRAVALALQKTKERYRKCILELKCRFRQKLESELEKAWIECNRKMQEAILEERADITREMMKKMRDEIGFVVITIYHHFENNLLIQKQNMIAEFNQIMRYDRLKTDEAVREIIRKKEEEFRSTLETMQLQKIVDLTYVLCSERIRCSSEKQEMRQSFEEQIEDLQKMLSDANRVIGLLKVDAFEDESAKICKTKIIDIVKQFQKFINFTFCAVPGQAEFFLSLEKLLMLEVDQKISDQKISKKEEKEDKKKEKKKKSLMKNVVACNQIRTIKDRNCCIQTPEEFRISRVQSLKEMLKLRPSLKNILIPHIGETLY